MNGPIVIVPKYSRLGEGFSRQEKAVADEHPGRRTTPHGYQSPVAWISDLIALKKCLLLCSFCRPRFNFRKLHYRKFYCADITGMTDGHLVNGKCDACKQHTANCGGGTAFVHEEEYSKVCVDPMDARRKARAKAKAMNAWSLINRRR